MAKVYLHDSLTTSSASGCGSVTFGQTIKEPKCSSRGRRIRSATCLGETAGTMFLPGSVRRLVRRFSALASTAPEYSGSDWKTQARLIGLASEISSILLQRRDWTILVRNLKPRLPKARLTPQLFLEVLRKTRASPKTTIDFFDWAKTHLRFEPDLRSHCRVIEIAAGLGLSERAETMLRSLVETHPPTLVVGSMARWFEGKDSLSVSLSLVAECYAKRGFCQNGLQVFVGMRSLGFSPSLRAYNSLLHALVKKNQFRLACCLYSAMVRSRAVADTSTLNLVAQILSEHGKYRSIVKLLETGVASCEIYSNLIQCYSRHGEFTAVFRVLDEMRERKFELSFSSYSCVLDDACRLGDAETIDKVVGISVEITHLHSNDSTIQRLCDMGKAYASELLFYKSYDGAVKLQDSTYGCLLLALSRKGRTEEAVRVYRLICRKGVTVDENCYSAFADALCGEDDDSEENHGLLIDVIRRGFIPSAVNVSNRFASLCRKGRWDRAEELLDMILEMGFCPDLLSAHLLMDRYCSSGKLDKAMVLHGKIKETKGSLDVNAYNALLDRLIGQTKMVDKAVEVFEHMKRVNSLNSKSFTIMIRGMCRAKEMRKAMKFHDEMMKIGMKPDIATYKRLISGFK
ncbi:PREDICTED: pentatricopeptide repeat-containing protein At4g21170 [Tarenaya hassleriana]|uniref:pentatricopeptide repeat-containing protein At4g21170 n=1 Tax=Tarenaya hassleriana TaxID=28532 RepID=UPI00053C6EB7|nr:PREDICTED: pentatricopeptide repeat-containing protein At4g21170 [Tarenaya hassleriana]